MAGEGGAVAGGNGALALALVDGLPSGAVVLDASDAVVLANPAALAMRVVVDGRLVVGELRDLAAAVRRTRRPRAAEVLLPVVPEPPLRRPRPDTAAPAVRVQAWAVNGDHVALVLDDITDARRVEAVRRDFVANVSHELKTPIGGLTLLAEAMADASEEPEAVRRFAARMGHEAARLGRLVQELLDLSRLQGADPLPEPRVVTLGAVVSEAIDRTRMAAHAKGITVAVVGETRLATVGDESQIATALANLLDNAIAYSPSRTRVVIGIRAREAAPDVPPPVPSLPYEFRTEGWVELSVADEGIGIAPRDLERIFERFYRADPARSRATGGTGLGLAIVKHIGTNHGGSVSVWSVEGQGSTFTLRLPRAAAPPEGEGQ